MKDDSVKNEGPKPKKKNNASSLKSQIPKFPKLFLFLFSSSTDPSFHLNLV
jgi:hypothetical protein